MRVACHLPASVSRCSLTSIQLLFVQAEHALSLARGAPYFLRKSVLLVVDGVVLFPSGTVSALSPSVQCVSWVRATGETPQLILGPESEEPLSLTVTRAPDGLEAALLQLSCV